MDRSAVIQRVDRVIRVRADGAADASLAASALRDVQDVRSFLDAAEADLVKVIRSGDGFAEATIADTSRASLGKAANTIERSATLDAVPQLAVALDDGRTTGAHIDTITRASKSLEPEQRHQLLTAVDALADVAASATVEQFGQRVRTEARRIQSDDGMARLERQKRATSMNTWVDSDGMWNVRGKYDPITGVKLAAALDTAVETLFAEHTPDTCPSDPIEKQKHLRALAFDRLARGTAGRGRSGRPEYLAVIDVTANPQPDAAADKHSDTVPRPGAPAQSDTGQQPRTRSQPTTEPASDTGLNVTWPIPIEVPARILADMISDGDTTTVVVRNGVVLHAPGELDLGRTTRLANRAQRRALRGLYRHCAIPGCTVNYDRCKLHHIIWWRNGGRTDLDNLVPVCIKHHGNIHNDNWHIELGANRELTVTLPGGQVMTTGPPSRRAA